MDDAGEVLFDAVVPVSVHAKDREDRNASLTVHISAEWTDNHQQRTLHVRLTEEADPFFLYQLTLSEEDFQALRTEQCLLVDFATFPRKVIELLEECQAAAANNGNRQFHTLPYDRVRNLPWPHIVSLIFLSHASFFAHLFAAEHGAESSFNITETNPFKQLTHLSLRCRAGNDTAVKKYLASRLSGLKAGNAELKSSLQSVSEQLQAREKECNGYAQERALSQQQHEQQIRELQAIHAKDAAEAKERAMVELAEARAQADRDVRAATALHAAETELLNDARSKNNGLIEARHIAESSLRECTLKLQAATEEASSSQEENMRLREQNRELERLKFEHETQIQEAKVRIAVLDQQVVDKDELGTQRMALLEAASENKVHSDESANMYKERVRQLESSMSQATTEIHRGNDIIARLQTEIKSLKAKLKIKAALLQQQEIALEDRKRELDTSERRGENLEHERDAARKECSHLEENVADLTKKLEEDQKLLESNQNVISWLNKEITESQVSWKRPSLDVAGRAPPYSSVSPYRVTTALSTRSPTVPRYDAGEHTPGVIQRPGQHVPAVIQRPPVSRKELFKDLISDKENVENVKLPKPGISAVLASASSAADKGCIGKEYLTPTLSTASTLAAQSTIE